MKIPKDLKWKSTGDTLGQGGQAQVYIVKDESKDSSRLYALKALRNNGSEQAYKRFYREICAVKELDHPNIIKIFDHSDPNSDFHFYVMEYVEGAKALDKLIFSNENPFYNDPCKALKLFEQICVAIFECERSKSSIVHRDLCPSNILFLPDSTIKL